MAVEIPNQNNLNDIIKASTELLNSVRQTLSEHGKKTNTVKPDDLNKEFVHIKDDVKSVVDFVKELMGTGKDIDNVVDNLVEILGMPARINKRISDVKVEKIESEHLELAVRELRRVLSTPAEINELLALNSQPINLFMVQRALDQIIFVCKLPGRINAKLKKIKIDDFDTQKITAISDGIDSIFGKGGLIDKVDLVAKKLDKFEGLSVKKLMAVWSSIFFLNVFTEQLSKFGDYSHTHTAELKFAMAGTKTVLKFNAEFSKVIQEIDKVDLIGYLTLPYRIKLMNRVLEKITSLLNHAASTVTDLPAATVVIGSFGVINKALLKLIEVIDTINELSMPVLILLLVKIPLITKVVGSVRERLIPELILLSAQIAGIVLAISGMDIVDKALEKLGDIIKTISAEKMPVLLINLLKIRLLSRNARLIRNLISSVTELARVALVDAAIMIPGLSVAQVALSIYANVIATIKAIKQGLLFRFKIRQLILGARLVRVLLRVISNLISIRKAARAFLAVKLANAIIKSFAAIIINILLLTPLMAMFILFSPVIILVFWLFSLVFKVIVQVLARIISPKVVIVIMAVTGIIMMLCILGLSLVALALISISIVENTLNILMFFGVVVAVALLLALIGLVLTKASPLIMAAIYGIGMVALAVFAVLAIAAMLWLLTKIELDQDKIKENVKKVMTTVLYIITCLFEDELDDPKGKDSVFTKILKVLGGAVAKIVMALATCAILVATFVTVACILMIATMLRLLQNLNLDQNKILRNVDLVFDTVEKIIGRFMSNDPNSKKSNRGILLSIVSWVCPPLAKIAEAMLTVQYLFLMFIATTIVLGLATMLRLLQNLSLNGAKILANVDVVFNTIDQIIERIFTPREDNGKKSNRGILVTIVSWVDEGLAKIVEAALGIVYLALSFIAVGLVLAIATALRLLQSLDLKEDVINNNVATVFKTVDHIINRIFGPRDDTQYPSSRGVLVTIISWVDPSLAKIVEAALSIVYLMLTLTAITIVLGIAGLLKLIEMIDLNEETIDQNITTIFNIVDKIISRVFAPADDNVQASRGVFGKIIGFFSPALASIVDAIMAVARLGMIFLAITVVVGIAESLKQIEELNLNEGKIIQQVDSIFKICGDIMSKIYEKSDTMLPEPKNRGIFGSIISFFSPDLADILDALTMIAKLAVVQTAISAIAGIGSSLKQIEELDVNLTATSSKVDEIMGIAENVCEKIFSRESKIKFPVPPEERKSVFGALISWAFGGKTDEDRALEAAMKKVEALGIIEAAVGALGNILEGAKRILDMDVSNIADAAVRVDEVMDMASKLSESIFGSNVKITLPEPSNDEINAALIDLGFDHWWRSSNASEIASAKAQASMKLAMQRVETLGLIASAVGSIASIIEGIEKVKTYKAPDLTTIRKNVSDIMTTASQVSFMIFNQEGIGQVGGNLTGIKSAMEEIKARVDFSKSGTDGVAQVCESFTNLIEKAKFDDAQVAATKTKVSSAISAISEIITQIDDIKPEAGGSHVENNCELIDRISKTVGSFVKVDAQDVKNSKNITENYIKFFKQVDSMDLKKLQHTDWLMRSWASISRDLKGDFEGLAKTVNQHIMPMLEKVNETLEKTTKAQQDIIKVMSQPVDLNNGPGSTPSLPSDTTSPNTANTPDTTSPNTANTPDTTSTTGNRSTSTRDGKNRAPGLAGAGLDPEDMKPGTKYIVTIAGKVSKA